MNSFSDRRGMLMSSLMASLLVACGPEQAPAADVKASERSEVTTLEQGLITDGAIVSLINRGSGRCMEISHRNMKDGGAIQLWDCISATNQDFLLRSDGAGFFSIIAQHSGLCVSVGFTNTQPGAALYQYSCYFTDNQKFSFVKLSNGYYNIRPKLQPSALVSVVENNWDRGSVVGVGLGSSAAGEFMAAL